MKKKKLKQLMNSTPCSEFNFLLVIIHKLRTLLCKKT